MSTDRLSPHQRRAQHRQEMTAAILDTARELMREEGVAGLSLHELARRLSMRAPSLYTYFPGKLAIYDALFREGWTLFTEQLTAALAGADFWAGVEQVLRLRLEFALDYPELHQLMTERPVPGFVPSEASLELTRILLEDADAAARRAQETGQLRADLDLREVRDLLIAVSHGLAALHLANEPHLPIGQGRFASLVPAAMAMLRAAWAPAPGPNPTQRAGQER